MVLGMDRRRAHRVTNADRPKHKLHDLEPMLHRYCVKVWDTHGRAKRSKGADPNAPREPGYFGIHVRRAARIVDVILGANVGVLDSAFTESEDELSERLRALVNEHPRLARMFDKGIEHVYLGAGLTRGEADCVRYQHLGLSHSGIAELTGRPLGTAQFLLARAHYKLRCLVIPDDVGDVEWPWSIQEKEAV